MVKEGGKEEAVECAIGDVATVTGWHDGRPSQVTTGEKGLDPSRLEGSYRGC